MVHFYLTAIPNKKDFLFVGLCVTSQKWLMLHVGPQSRSLSIDANQSVTYI